MSRLPLTVAVIGGLLTQLSSGVLAQAPPPFVARANVTVANNSPVPQIVAGTSVAPFTLLPNQQAQLRMSIVPPPGAVVPGGIVPLRFEYSVGQAPGPRCRGTIDMSLRTRGSLDADDQITHCLARSLGTDGARCNIAVSARNAACVGGLAFSAR
ncbi:MAG TPA: hypothetical protein VMF05_13400 [Stellaceae bacterium]|nr:hypothetical protein [Stellaceae bacterium]